MRGIGWAGATLALVWMGAGAADLKEAQQEFLSGNYVSCVATARQALKDDNDEEWHLLLARALMESGQYPEARAAITNALTHDRWNARFCWEAHEVFQANGQTEQAAEMAERVVQLVSAHPRDFRDPASLVVFGRAALLKGADPKRVLDSLFDVARRADPKLRDSYLASGGLALEKHDFALAAKRFQDGLKELPEDPDLLCGLAQAYAPSDPALALSSLESALVRNSNHVGSLLLLADHQIDAEDYGEAKKALDRTAKVNPNSPEGWAYRAVLAHLENHPTAEQEARNNGLKYWPANARVDYLIGRKLSQNYRFAEGAAHQRQALKLDSGFLPAKAQLAQDLLRLGEEREGWELAQEVQKRDPYDAEAYNLNLLRDAMAKFATLTNRDFLVRMGSREAAIYGGSVLELLSQAKSNLCAKYGVELPRPTTVEVFPEQKDFAVRTFGMPGNPGYLGVCFGNVITANSPAAQMGHPVNWQAVLWHEFCHVVTLNLTRNKMPRWLSEGISVYEESQANPAWGQRMNPRYREMILEGELTPIAKLSGAFLAPRSAFHLQFAYYESALVVEFIVRQFGNEAVNRILNDLGRGTDINLAIARATAPMDKLEADFAGFARQRAEQLAPGLDWQKPGDPGEAAGALAASQERTNPVVELPPRSRRHRAQSELGPDAMAEWSTAHPTNFYALTERAREAIEAKNFQEAKAPLKRLIELYPSQAGSDSAYALLAGVYRALGETNEERAVLTRFTALDDESTESYLRLMELAATAQDWPVVLQNAKRYLAVNPLVAPPYKFLAEASEHRGEAQPAVEAYRALLQLDPADPAEIHFRLGQALFRLGDPEARRQVLEALEEAPRYRQALDLLLEINRNPPQEPQTGT